MMKQLIESKEHFSQFIAWLLPIVAFKSSFKILMVEPRSDPSLEYFTDWFYLFAPLFVWTFYALNTKYFDRLWYKLSFALSFVLFYGLNCYFIAYYYRVLLGNTWTKKEVFQELVSSQPYFYFYGLFGLILIYMLYRRQYEKSVQPEDNAQA